MGISKIFNKDINSLSKIMNTSKSSLSKFLGVNIVSIAPVFEFVFSNSFGNGPNFLLYDSFNNLLWTGQGDNNYSNSYLLKISPDNLTLLGQVQINQGWGGPIINKDCDSSYVFGGAPGYVIFRVDKSTMEVTYSGWNYHSPGGILRFGNDLWVASYWGYKRVSPSTLEQINSYNTEFNGSIVSDGSYLYLFKGWHRTLFYKINPSDGTILLTGDAGVTPGNDIIQKVDWVYYDNKVWVVLSNGSISNTLIADILLCNEYILFSVLVIEYLRSFASLDPSLIALVIWLILSASYITL